MKLQRITRNLVLAVAMGLVAASAHAAQSGSRTYAKTCGNCHEYGAMGAPRFGEADEWRPRLSQGSTVLYQHAITGVGRMPPRGGNAKLSDDEVRRAVDYMVEAAQ